MNLRILATNTDSASAYYTLYLTVRENYKKTEAQIVNSITNDNIGDSWLLTCLTALGLVIGLSTAGAVVFILLVGAMIFLYKKRNSDPRSAFEAEFTVVRRNFYFTFALFYTARHTNVSLNSYNPSNSSNYSEQTSTLLSTGIWSVKYSDLKLMMPPLVKIIA
jgi:hypothetical protein